MSSGIEETKTEGAVEVKTEGQVQHNEKLDHSEVLTNKDLMHEAIEGENQEHQMGVWEAAKTHPWLAYGPLSFASPLSWSPSTCS